MAIPSCKSSLACDCPVSIRNSFAGILKISFFLSGRYHGIIIIHSTDTAIHSWIAPPFNLFMMNAYMNFLIPFFLLPEYELQ